MVGRFLLISMPAIIAIIRHASGLHISTWELRKTMPATPQIEGYYDVGNCILKLSSQRAKYERSEAQ